jgi:hypothetical protein
MVVPSAIVKYVDGQINLVELLYHRTHKDFARAVAGNTGAVHGIRFRSALYICTDAGPKLDY